MTKVLVTGATGNVGRHVVRELRARGASVRAFVRDPQRATERLGKDVELAVGDFTDPVALRRAMQGIDRMFLTCSDGPNHVAHENAAIDAAATAWIERIVKLSAIGAVLDSPLSFSVAHARIEQHLRASPVPWVILNASFLMSNVFAATDTIRQSDCIVAPADGAKITMIDPRDVAATAALVLLADGHAGRAYTITGPRAVTYTDVAADLSASLGRQITFVNVSDESARAALLESGAPEWFADGLVVLFRLLRDGLLAHATDSVRILTGREARSFAEFSRDHRHVFDQAVAPSTTADV